MIGKPLKLALVIPVYGNEGSLVELHRRIDRALSLPDIELTICFVNDRSPDNSQQVLQELAAGDSRVRILLLSKNHGSFVAIVAGLNNTRDHDAVIILSADLQDPPEVIPQMIRKWREGFPVVLCVRHRRSDSTVARFFSSLFHKLYRRYVLPDMPEGGFDFCLIDRKVADVLIESSEKNTSLVGLIIWAGFDRAYVPYDRAERVHGKSMWSFRKKVRYAINSVISFSSLPLRLSAFLGVAFSLVCFSGIVITLYNYLSGRIPVSGWTSLVLVILFVASFQFLSFGILGEYFWNNLEQSRKRPLFIIDKKIGFDASALGCQPDATNTAVPFFDLQAVSASVIAGLDQAAKNVLKGSQIILGPAVERFEKEFAEYMGMEYATGVANGTDAIILSLWAAGLEPGDKVITSSISAPATAVAIIRAGMTPYFVDVDEKYLTIDPAEVKAAAAQGAKAIVPVHLYGNPSDMDALIQIAEKYQMIIIEDCAQSSGTRINDRHCGFFSRAAAFSFYPTKNLGAYGDAGAVLTSDKGLAEKLKKMRFYGQDAAGECVFPGINSRLDEMQAALLCERLKVIEGHNDQRINIARQYDAALSFLNPVPSGNGRVPHLYVVRPDNREAFRQFLMDHDIQTGVHYPLALHQHEYLRKNSLAGKCPVAEDACRHVVSLPCFPGLEGQAVEKIIGACLKWRNIRS